MYGECVMLRRKIYNDVRLMGFIYGIPEDPIDVWRDKLLQQAGINDAAGWVVVFCGGRKLEYA